MEGFAHMPCAYLHHHHHHHHKARKLCNDKTIVKQGKYQVDIYNNINSLLTYSAVRFTKRLI